MNEKILVPLDGSKVGEAALPHVESLLSKLVPQVQVEVILLQVLSPMVPRVVQGYESIQVDVSNADMEQKQEKAMEYLNNVSEALRSKGAVVTARVGVGTAPEEIVRTGQEINADLIAMSTHGRSGISRLTLGSVADKVLREGNVPLLLVKAPKETE